MKNRNQYTLRISVIIKLQFCQTTRQKLTFLRIESIIVQLNLIGKLGSIHNKKYSIPVNK